MEQPPNDILFLSIPQSFLSGFMSKLKNLPEISYSDGSFNFPYVVYSCTAGEWNRQLFLCIYFSI